MALPAHNYWLVAVRTASREVRITRVHAPSWNMAKVLAERKYPAGCVASIAREEYRNHDVALGG